MTAVQVSIRPIAEAMHEKLPRELRNFVYSYLWGLALSGKARWLYQEIKVYRGQNADNDLNTQIPPFALPDYTGKPVADEALSCLYRATFQQRQRYHAPISATLFSASSQQIHSRGVFAL